MGDKPAPKPSYDARKRAADKLEERFNKHSNLSPREAEKLAKQIARDTDKKNGNG